MYVASPPSTAKIITTVQINHLWPLNIFRPFVFAILFFYFLIKSFYIFYNYTTLFIHLLQKTQISPVWLPPCSEKIPKDRNKPNQEVERNVNKHAVHYRFRRSTFACHRYQV